MSFFYCDANGSQAGPVPPMDLVSLIRTQEISATSLAWKDGMPDWRPINEIPELKDLLSAPQPPPMRSGPPPVPLPPKIPRAAAAASTPTPAAPNEHEHEKKRSNFVPGDNDKSWVEKLTADKVPYYFNTVSETVSWDKPNCLKTAEERQHDDGEWIWVSDPTEAWVPARVKSRNGESVSVILPNNSKKTVNKSPTEPLWPLNHSSLARPVDDMVMVESLNHAQMIHLLKSRYNEDHIYTWVGASHSVLVSINPFKQLPIYTVNAMADFAHSSPNRLDPPHTFAIANSAFQNMSKEGSNQAVLISGESGAGKTEATKQCFNFLAEIAGSELQLEQKILNANPILEAFGNAKTLRNNNSSRFGRWTEINFSSKGQIIGASIENYLLEKSRVVHQNSGERNYHIFYQLCACLSGPLSLPDPRAFRYLNTSGCTSAEGINDREDFSDVNTAFQLLGFTSTDINWVFEACAGILHLSNVTFLPNGEGSKIHTSAEAQTALSTAAGFLKVDMSRLANALCSRTIEVRGELSNILHRPKEACEAADALSKAIYNQLFNWLVARINASVKGSKGNFIGVLDIFGFEIFENNGFEQLCINFTNEKLQQHFNAHTFKEEEQTYISEEVPYDPVMFIDNQPVLDLIEKKPVGLFHLLDEEVRLPKGDDTKWLEKCHSNHSIHANWINEQSKLSSATRSTFFIQHYAGTVAYDSSGFCEKNRDSLFRDLYDLMSSAAHPNWVELFPEKDKNPRRVETLSGAFRKQLTNLMTVCETTQPHYIRCIKPNQNKAPRNFNSVMCLEQLTYAGVFEAVQIRKTGYPFRLPHSRFAARYRPLLLKSTGKPTAAGAGGGGGRRNEDPVDTCRLILSSVPQDFSRVAIGRSMVLYRAEEHRILELLRNLYLDRIIPIAQRRTRQFIGKQFRKALRVVNKHCREALEDGNDVDLFDEAIELSQTSLTPFRLLFNYEPSILTRARDRRFCLEERVKLNLEFRRLARLDCDEYFDEFIAAIQRSDKIKDTMPGTPEDIAVENGVREKVKNIASVKIDAWAREVLDILDKNQMVLVVAEAEKYAYNSSEVTEIIALLSLPEDKFVRKQLKRAKEIGDNDRVVNREIRLKDLFLNMYGSLFEFGPNCSVVRNAQEWASAKFFGMNKMKLAMGMLIHTATPIHQTLTPLDANPQELKISLKAFKNLMGFMGDRKYNYPETLAVEFLKTGMEGSTAVKTELYVQVLKQLTDNPNINSEVKGWEMLALMLSCFAPPEIFENFVAMFIRKNAPKMTRHRYRVFLHSSIYGTLRSSPPTVEELESLLSQFNTKEIDEKFFEEDVVKVRGGVNDLSLGTSPTAAAAPSPLRSPAATAFANPSATTPPPPPPPRAAPAPQQPKYVVAFEYNPSVTEEGMMAIFVGDVLEVSDKSDNDWWMASNVSSGKSGWIPAAYVRLQ